jgi:hypothetical protein
MKYNTLIDEFLKSFPELMEGTKAFNAKWEPDIPVHVYFMVVANPYIEQKLKKHDSASLIHLFVFFESMAQSDDKSVREVLSDTILEKIGDDKNDLEFARKYMGPKTRKLSDDAEKFLGRLS